MKKIFKLIPVFIFFYVLSTFLWRHFEFDSRIAALPEEIKNFVNNYASPISILALIETGLFSFFWRIPGINRVSQCLFDTNPYIKGTWCGTLHYTWDGEEQKKVVYLSIFQPDAYTVQCNLYTKERTSCSETVFVDRSQKIKRLIFTYSAEKPVRAAKENPQHNGVSVLTIGENKKTLTGEYFTNRNTSGRLVLEFLSKKTASSFDDAVSVSKRKKRRH